ncbi:TetR family transcriptional regulator [Nocardioidaceae bacterium]|nr:TetR family transcriptional regulator [Nocardioidaceae bacterium]
MSRTSRAGRRGASSTARDDIAKAARALFGDVGFDTATMRGIAHRAGVDQALIGYFFGSKQELFAQVMDLPLDPAVVIPHVTSGGPREVGERLARVVLEALDDPARRAVIEGMVRSAASHPHAAAMIRDRITATVLLPLASAVAGGAGEQNDAELRASLAMSQVLGLVMARHVVALEVLQAASTDVLIAQVAPTLQRHLVGGP